MTDAGVGATINIPVPAGTAGDVYRMAWDEIIGPVLTQYDADWILVSAGYDAHADDPLAELRLEAGDFGWMASRLSHQFEANKPVLLFLEGGYHLPALTTSVTSSLRGLFGETPEPELGVPFDRRRLSKHRAGQGGGRPVLVAVNRKPGSVVIRRHRIVPHRSTCTGCPREVLSEVSVTLQIAVRPAVAELYFWALQASFTGPDGISGGAHLGLQWHPSYPGSGAVNWGGYARDGSILEGSDSALPSTLGNVNTRDYPVGARSRGIGCGSGRTSQDGGQARSPAWQRA